MNSFLASPALPTPSWLLPSSLTAEARSRELILADGLDPAIGELLRDAPVRSAVLPVSSAPLQAITLALAGERLDVLHLVAHGRAGGFSLDGQWIDAQALRQAAPLLAQWQVGAIALWSCAAGADRQLVDTLARLTGARVHAAQARLGATAAGRAWALQGEGETITPPFAPHALETWPHELASYTFSKVYQVTNTVGKESNSHTFLAPPLKSYRRGQVS